MSRNPFASVSVGPARERHAIRASEGIRPERMRCYVSGETDSSLSYITIPEFLKHTCVASGGSTAVVFPAQNVSLSWNQLQEQADKFAAGLLSLGINRGDRVAIWSPNRIEWIIAQFGSARIGAILVNINPAYQQTELEYALNKVGARLLVMARGQKSTNYLSILKNLAPEIDLPPTQTALSALYLQALPTLQHVVVLDDGSLPAGCLAWDNLQNLAGPAQQRRLDTLTAALDPDDAINIQFTSGTTGTPKGATLSHFNIVNNACATANALQLSANDVLCIPVPLYHCFGMVLGVLACVSKGATMVFPGESFDAANTLAAIERYRCTALHGVPTMFISMLEHKRFTEFDVSSLRTGIMAGASCPAHTMRKVMTDMHMHEVTIAYGMTETSPVSFQSATDDPIERRVATVGRVQPHVEAKVVDESGAIVTPGIQGELCTRGYLVMLGYWGVPSSDPENPIDEAGWMHTGDLAVIDSDGYCEITGRVSDMLIRGGENIYPRELEEFLMTHPGVQDVQVFGIPDQRFGEVVCAWVIPRTHGTLDAELIRQFCSGSIAHYKIPAHVQFVSEFPMTITGKPRKVEMRDAMIEQLALQAGSH